MNQLRAFLTRAGTVRGLQIFQLLRFLTFFVTGILLSKTFLTVREIGIYENILFLSGAVSFFWVSGLLNSLLSRYNEADPVKAASQIFNGGLLLITMNLLMVLCLVVFKQSVCSFIPENAADLFPFLIAYILLNNPAFLIEYILLLRKKPLQLVVYGLSTFAIHLLMVFVPLLTGKDLMYTFAGLCCLALLKNIYLFILLRQNGTAQVQFDEWKEHLTIAIPLTLSLLISGSAEYIDGFLVSSFFGSDAFVVFRYGAKELPLATLMANSLSMAMVPMLRKGNSVTTEGLQLLKKETSGLMHFLFPVTLLLLLLSPVIYPVLFRPEFSQSAGIFNIYLLLVISRMLFPQAIIMATQNTGIIFKTSLLEITLNIVCSYLLMLRFGIMGVAAGTLIAFFGEKLILVIWCRIRLGIHLTSYLSVRIWLIYTFLLLTAYFLSIKFGYLIY